MACRVCNSSDNPICIFDIEWEPIEGNSLQACLEIMTGISISPSDIVPTKICSKCVISIQKHMVYRLKSFRYLEENEVPMATEEVSDNPQLVVTDAKPFACCLCYGVNNLLNVLETELTFINKYVLRSTDMETGDEINFDTFQKICQRCVSSIRLLMKKQNVAISTLELPQELVEQGAGCSISEIEDDITLACYMCYGKFDLEDMFDSEWNYLGYSLPDAIKIITGNEITLNQDQPQKMCQSCLSALRKSMRSRVSETKHLGKVQVTIDVSESNKNSTSGHRINFPQMLPLEIEKITKFPNGVEMRSTTYMVPILMGERKIHPTSVVNHDIADMVCSVCENTFNLVSICEPMPIVSEDDSDEEVSTNALTLQLCSTCLELLNSYLEQI